MERWLCLTVKIVTIYLHSTQKSNISQCYLVSCSFFYLSLIKEHFFILVAQASESLEIGVVLGATSESNFYKLKAIVKGLVEKYKVTNNENVKVGLVEYSQTASTVKSMSPTASKEKIQQLINNLSHRRGRANLFLGVKHAQNQFFNSCLFSRCKQPGKKLLVFSDEQPSQDTKDILNTTTHSGVDVVFVFISREEDITPSDLGLSNYKTDVRIVDPTDNKDAIVADITSVLDPGKKKHAY